MNPGKIQNAGQSPSAFRGKNPERSVASFVYVAVLWNFFSESALGDGPENSRIRVKTANSGKGSKSKRSSITAKYSDWDQACNHIKSHQEKSLQTLILDNSPVGDKVYNRIFISQCDRAWHKLLALIGNYCTHH